MIKLPLGLSLVTNDSAEGTQDRYYLPSMETLGCIVTLLFKRLILVAATLLITVPVQPQETARHPNSQSDPVTGSLDEIRGKRRVHLLVIRSNTVDASGDPAQVAVEAVREGRRTERRFRYTYATIGKKLNKYIREYQGISGVSDPTQADYVIVFNLLRYRRILNSVYPEGEMFVVSYSPPAPARVLWRTEKEMLADDAAAKLVKALKGVNGQR